MQDPVLLWCLGFSLLVNVVLWPLGLHGMMMGGRPGGPVRYLQVELAPVDEEPKPEDFVDPERERTYIKTPDGMPPDSVESPDTDLISDRDLVAKDTHQGLEKLNDAPRMDGTAPFRQMERSNPDVLGERETVTDPRLAAAHPQDAVPQELPRPDQVRRSVLSQPDALYPEMVKLPPDTAETDVTLPVESPEGRRPAGVPPRERPAHTAPRPRVMSDQHVRLVSLPSDRADDPMANALVYGDEAYNIKQDLYAPYYEHVRTRVGFHWYTLLASTLAIRSYLGPQVETVVITFWIERDGTLTEVQLREGEQDVVFSAICSSAVEESVPLDPLPDYVTEPRLGIAFSFTRPIR